MKDLEELFYDCCVKYSDIRHLLHIEADILALSKKKKSRILLKGFEIACSNGNEETLEALLFHPSFKIAYNAEVISQGLMTGIEYNSVDTLKYLLIEAPLSIKENQTQGGEYIQLCYGALWYAIANPNRDNYECVGFLIDYLHEYTFDKYKYPIHILKEDHGHIFKTAWSNNNSEALKILIDKYEINGQEPGIKDFLEEQKNTELKDKDVIMTMIRCNFEKPMLESMVGEIEGIPLSDTMGNSMISNEKNAVQTKVVKNKQKNKI